MEQSSKVKSLSVGATQWAPSNQECHLKFYLILQVAYGNQVSILQEQFNQTGRQNSSYSLA